MTEKPRIRFEVRTVQGPGPEWNMLCQDYETVAVFVGDRPLVRAGLLTLSQAEAAELRRRLDAPTQADTARETAREVYEECEGLAKAVQHPNHAAYYWDGPNKPPKAKFYQHAQAVAWQQAGHRVAAAISKARKVWEEKA